MRDVVYGLDFVRFLAAASVLSWHLGFRVFDPDSTIAPVALGIPEGVPHWSNALRWGWIGVEVFFVISGLVISYSLERAAPLRFLKGRVARLFPAMLICATAILALDVLFLGEAPGASLLAYLKSLTFWPLGGWSGPHFWTLPIEIVFYGLMLLLMATGQLKRLDQVAAGLAAWSLAYWIWTSAPGHDFPHIRVARLSLAEHGAYFGIGMALSAIARKGLTPLRLATILIGAVAAVFEIRSAAAGYGVSAPGESYWMLPFGVWLGALSLIALSLRYRSEATKAVIKAPRLGAGLRLLGLATYPLYLIHMHLGGLGMTLAVAAGQGTAVAFLVGGLLSLAVAVVIATVVEPPLHRKIAAWLDGVGRPGRA